MDAWIPQLLVHLISEIKQLVLDLQGNVLIPLLQRLLHLVSIEYVQTTSHQLLTLPVIHSNQDAEPRELDVSTQQNSALIIVEFNRFVMASKGITEPQDVGAFQKLRHQPVKIRLVQI